MRKSKRQVFALMAGIIGLAALPAFGNTNVLFDDFNDGNFAGWTVNKGSWTVVNGTLVGHETWPNLDAYIYTGNSNWNDIVFEADMVFQSGSAELMFRSTGHWTNEYRLGLYSQGAEAYANRFFFWEYNNGVPLLHSTNLPNIVDGNALSPVPITDTAHVRIEALGSLLSFYINDALMYQFDDPTPLSGGQVGLGVIWNWTDGFDNVSVTVIPEPHGVPFFIGAVLVVAALHLRRKRLTRDPKEPTPD